MPIATWALAALAVLNGCASMERDDEPAQIVDGHTQYAAHTEAEPPSALTAHAPQPAAKTLPPTTRRVASNAAGSKEQRLRSMQRRLDALFERLQAARDHLDGGRLAPAEAAALSAIQLDPNHVQANALLRDIRTQQQIVLQLGEVERLAQSDRAEAATRLKRLLKLAPDNKRALALMNQLEPPSAPVEPLTLKSIYTKPVSIQFKDANLKSVFEFLSRSTGINFVIDRDVRDAKTSIFVKNISMEEALDLILMTNQLDKKVLNRSTVYIYPNTPAKQRENQDLIIKAFYLAHADPKQALNMIKTLVKTRDVYIDEKLNLIVMRDTADAIRTVERLIAFQDRAEPEVMLEVEVLEVQRNNLTNLGVQVPTGTTLSIPQLTLSQVLKLNKDLVNVSGNAVSFNFLRQYLDADILANPMIRVKNREKARVHIGDKIPIITATTSATGGFVSDSVQYLDVGIRLEVEPEISLDQQVAIKVALEVSTPGAKTRTSAGTEVFQIGSRSANTSLRLKDGETQILAGLISDQERRTLSGVPGLSNLPILGRLFRNESSDHQKTEIVLAITPRLVAALETPRADALEFWSGTDSRLGGTGARASSAQSSANIAAPAVPTANQPAATTLGTPAASLGTAATPANTAVDQAMVPTVQPGTSVPVRDIGGAQSYPLQDALQASPDDLPTADDQHNSAEPMPQTASDASAQAQGEPAKTAMREGRTPARVRSSAPDPLRVRWSGPTTLKAGEPATFTLHGSSKSALQRLSFQVAYDPMGMQFDSITEGDFVRPDDAPTTFQFDNDSAAGRISVNWRRADTVAAATRSSGVIATVKFRATGKKDSVTVKADALSPVGADNARVIVLPAPAYTIKLAN